MNILQRSLNSIHYGLNSTDFSDTSHLSDRGAEKFTSKLFNNAFEHLELKNKPLQLLQSY